MAAEWFSRGNEAFVDENYDEAIKFYCEAINLEPKHHDFYINRAKGYIKLDKYEEAVRDADDALKISPKNSKAFHRKGEAYFHLGKFHKARQCFIDGQTMNVNDKSLQTWISQCELKMSSQNLENQDKGESESGAGATDDTHSQTTQPALVDMPTGAKTRYDWYQTETHVIVTILIKQVTKEDFSMDLQDKSLSVTIKMAMGSDYFLELNLQHPVISDESSSKLLNSKVEIKLKKLEAIRWSSLEGEYDVNVKYFTPASVPSDAKVQDYPSSSHYTRNWDKLAHEIKEEEKNEKPEGDAALNSLFEKIYCDGSDEVKKAMNKSFSESGGTVLSTNWGDIGEKETEIKPPDGMEWKKYQN